MDQARRRSQSKPWYQSVLPGALVAFSTIGIFSGEHLNLLQTSCLTALFSSGMAGLTFFMLPGEITFKRAGIVAVGALALFLALLYWLKPVSDPPNLGATGGRPVAAAILTI
jgi:hypothetical protein